MTGSKGGVKEMLDEKSLSKQTFYQSNAYANFELAVRDYARILIKEKGQSPVYVIRHMKDIVNDTVMDEITEVENGKT